MAATVLDSGNANTGIVLSGGNLTATKSGVNYASVMSTTSKSSGKWYFEVTVNSQGSTTSLGHGALAVSIANSLPLVTHLPGETTIGLTWDNFGNPALIFNNVQKTGPGNASNTQVVGIAFDIGNKNVWFFNQGTWDGSGTDNPVGNIGGANGAGFFAGGSNALFTAALFACLSVYDSSSLTANFGATPYTHPIPSGYLSWDPQVATNMLFSG